MILKPAGILSICLWALCPATGHASDRSWGHASTIGADALIATALIAPTINNDWDGGVQAVGSMGGAAILSVGLKKAFPETRPDGSNRESFPSMHTAISFAAAASLQNRYGWEVGVPAQMVAAFVGFARVKAHSHHWYDVVVGAAIGEASGFLITSKFDRDVRVMPWGDTKGGGVAFNMKF